VHVNGRVAALSSPHRWPGDYPFGPPTPIFLFTTLAKDSSFEKFWDCIVDPTCVGAGM